MSGGDGGRGGSIGAGGSRGVGCGAGGIGAIATAGAGGDSAGARAPPNGIDNRTGPILPIRKGLVFANPEGSYFCQSRGVLFWPIRRGTIFVNPEGSCFS